MGHVRNLIVIIKLTEKLDPRLSLVGWVEYLLNGGFVSLAAFIVLCFLSFLLFQGDGSQTKDLVSEIGKSQSLLFFCCVHNHF